MKKIHLLAPQIISKIAAGEVIERPVYAVKELVENAIDAGADSIAVHIEESGLKKITVIDNGEGMSKEDLGECFKTHTTSKISRIDELSHIKTLGFRGEALSSIGAISRLTIASKRQNASSGYRLTVNDSKKEKMSPFGMPVGTTVVVDYLFHSLPARKKFLKNPRTEMRHIIELMTKYSISYPHIHFILTHNKRTVFDLPQTTDVSYRVEKLLGRDVFSSLVPVSYADSYISITGFIAKPNVTTKTPNKQFLFINNRLVYDKEISLTIKSVYGNLLANTVFPVCILHVSVPFERIDVNVHPRKEYVQFVDRMQLYSVVRQAISQSLERYDLTPAIRLEGLFLRDGVGNTESYIGKLLKEKKMPWELSLHIKNDSANIIQLNNLYLLVASDNGFMLIDQHAAHERILYEQLLAEFVKEKKKYMLFHFPKPEIFDLSFSESAFLQEHLVLFREMGWEIEHFRDTSFIIRSLPVIFQDRDYVKLLREMLEDLKEDSLQRNIDEISRRMIAYLACRGAVKAGDKLRKKQAKELVKKLEEIQNGATCPHGRPTKIAIDLEMIHRMFKR